MAERRQVDKKRVETKSGVAYRGGGSARIESGRESRVRVAIMYCTVEER